MTPRHLVLVLGALLLSAACASTHTELSVHTSHPPDVDFTARRAFRVASQPATATDGDRAADLGHSQRLDRLAREALHDELVARGFEAVDDGTPDFRVAWLLSFRSPGGRPPREGASVSDPLPPAATGSNPNGTLEVTMIEPTTLRVLWHGTVSGIRVDPLRPEQDLRLAARRLLAEFPPLAAVPAG